MKNLNCGIYQIRNLITGFCYTGQSINLKGRKSRHFSNLKKNNGGENRYLQNSFNKHGEKNFVFEAILYCFPKNLAKYKQMFDNINKRKNLSYNFRECVDSNKGLKHSEETIKKMRKVNSGKNNGMFGKTHSKETIEKMRKTKLGKHSSEETKRKISIATKGKNNGMFGKHHLKETRRRISIALKGENNPNYGKHFSEETREKMSRANSGKNHPMFGKHHSKKSKEKMSKANSGENSPMWGKYLSDETKEKIRKSRIGKKLSQETRRKISQSIKGKNHYRIIKKEIVLEIREMLNDNVSVKNILKNFEISRSTIYRVKNGYYDKIYNL